MQQYLLSVYQPDGESPAPQILGPIMGEVGAWEQERYDKAAAAYQAAIERSQNAAEREFLEQRRRTLDVP